MPARPRSDPADASVQAAISELTPLLAAFIANPFDAAALGNWYLALAEHCPLWGLQEREYFKLANGPSTKLVLDHEWRFMLAASEAAEHGAKEGWGPSGVPIIEPQRVSGRFRSVVKRPPDSLSPSGSRHALLHAYLSTLLRRVDDVPLRDAVRSPSLRVPENNKELPIGWDPNDPASLRPEVIDSVNVVDELRRRIVDRDLAPDKARRKAAQAQLGAYLKDLGVTARQQRPSLPNNRILVERLVAESRVWLPVERASRNAKLLSSTLERLGWWHCSSDPLLWAARLAFPFLTQREISFVRSPSRPSDDKLAAVYLIHCRVHDYVYLTTVGEYAFGTAFKRRLQRDRNLRHNPLCE